MSMYPISFLYTGGGTIEPYSVMQVYADTDYTANTPNARGRILLAGGSQVGGELPCTDATYNRSYLFAVNSETAVTRNQYGKCSFAFHEPAWARIKDDFSFPDELREPDVDYQGWELGPGDETWLNKGGRGFQIMGPPDFDNQRILVRQYSPEVPFEALVMCTECTSGAVVDEDSRFKAVPMRRAGMGKYKPCFNSQQELTPLNLLSMNTRTITVSHSKTGFIGFGSSFEQFMRVTVQWDGFGFETISGGMTTVEGVLSSDADGYVIEDARFLTGTRNAPCGAKARVDVPCDLVLPDDTYVYCLYDAFTKRLKVYDFCCSGTA